MHSVVSKLRTVPKVSVLPAGFVCSGFLLLHALTNLHHSLQALYNLILEEFKSVHLQWFLTKCMQGKHSIANLSPAPTNLFL